MANLGWGQVKCEKCEGSGQQSYQEDGRDVSDTCYRCSGSGKVCEEEAHIAKVERVAGILGAAFVKGWRESCNADPEGEGWAFRAAEDMMSEHDYTMMMVYDKTGEIGVELMKLSHVAQVALIEALLPKAPTPAEEVGKAEPGSFEDCDVAGHSDEDRIPF